MPTDTIPANLAAYLDSFVQGYVTCGLWTSYEGEGLATLDANFDVEDLTAEALAEVRFECATWIGENFALLVRHAFRLDRPDAEVASQAGHDFWLTRNRHGAGFWDRGLGDLGRDLTEASHLPSESNFWGDADGVHYGF